VVRFRYKAVKLEAEHKLLEQIIWKNVGANSAESCLGFILHKVATDVHEDLSEMVRGKPNSAACTSD
jgi:hypothetical protein